MRRFALISALIAVFASTFITLSSPAEAVPAFPDYRRTLRFEAMHGSVSEFPHPFFLSQDAANNFYVSELDDHKVYMYDSNGVFVREFGTGQTTNNNGDLVGPEGVASDGTTLFVADNTLARIQSFNLSTGAPITFIPLVGSGWFGLALGPDNNLYVANNVTDNVQVYTKSGAFVRNIGATGTGDGKLDGPFDVAFDSAGYLYVTESLNARVQKFNRNGLFVRKFGVGTLSIPDNIHVDSANNVWVTDRIKKAVFVFDAKGNLTGQYNGAGTPRYGTLVFPAGLAVVERANQLPTIYVSDLTRDDIQRFRPVTMPLAYTFEAKFGTVGAGNGQFNGPAHIAIDQSDNLYVSDAINENVQVFNNRGQFVSVFGTTGTAKGKWNQPFALGFDGTGRLFVADTSANKIRVYNSAGKFLFEFGSSGAGLGQFTTPNAFAFDALGNVYITDLNGRIQKFDQFGTFLAEIGTAGTGNGQFTNPVGVELDAVRKLLYIGDSPFGITGAAGRLQIFTTEGKATQNFAGTVSCPMDTLADVALDGRGGLYAVTFTAAISRVVKFTDNGECIGEVAGPGSGNGQLANPVGIAYSKLTGQLWVVDQGNDRVQRFGAPNVRADRGGVYRPSSKTFFLRNTNSAGGPDFSFALSWAAAGDVPVTGDWNADGVDSVGFYRAGQWLLSNLNASTSGPHHTFGFGQSGDIPLVGDWDGDGIDGIGVWRPSTQQFLLKNTLGGGNADLTFQLGLSTDKPIAGDWDGDGRTTVGVWRPSSGTFFLNNSMPTVGGVPIDVTVAFGASTDIPLAGDWTEQGFSAIGVWRPSSRNFLLRNTLTGGAANTTFTFGTGGDIPITGEWGSTFAEAVPPADAPPAAPEFSPKE